MINLVGRAPINSRIMEISGAKLHLYGKGARAGRKFCHVTLTGPTAKSLDAATAELERIVVWDA